MNYQDRLRSHLVKYKFRVLGVLSSGAWKGARTGALAERPHILPAGQERLNIVSPYRDRFWAEFGRGEGHALGGDFAHLTSSQALGFNLFYPLVVDRAWASAFVQELLGLKDATVRAAAFEYSADPHEGHHFDFFAELDSGERLYFEPRLAEIGFRTLDVPPRERDRLLERYARRLAGLVEPKWLEPDEFFRRYELLRALSCLQRPQHRLYLVLPRENQSLSQALAILPDIATAAAAERVHMLYLEDAVEGLRALARGRDEHLRKHYRELREKYVPLE
ncbi:MAG TPA: hypothetical protein VNU64_14440 [Burkholderiales bacterium]|nr:hypothetical protein [Burkholderiales bacterium]